MSKINIQVKIDDNGNIVTVTIPQAIPQESHLQFEMALQELESLLGTSERIPLEHFDLMHHHEHIHTHDH